jgi:hypothetical protein
MIEKNIRLQPHHARDLLVGRRSDGRRPGYQPPGHGGGGGRGGPGGQGGGGGRGRDPGGPGPGRDRHPPSPPSGPGPDRHPPSPPSGPGPDRHPPSPPTPSLGDAPGREFAIATQNITPTYDDYNYPGINETKQPITHHGADTPWQEAIQQKLDVEEVERQNKARDETKEPTTIEDKLDVEEWERDQDWDTVERLSKKGYDFDAIQTAMGKGILTKTGLGGNLLSKLKGRFDPKSMVGNVAKNFALKKLGLGWLNPVLGIASLFGFDPMKKAQAAFAPKPTFDPKKASQLGLYANRFPTDLKQPTTGSGLTTAQKIAMGEVDLNKLITGNNLSGIKGYKAEVTKQDLAKYTNRTQKSLIDAQDYNSALDSGTINPDMSKYEFQQMKKGTITEPGTYIKGETGPIMVGAKGGRVDKALSGRSRDI